MSRTLSLGRSLGVSLGLGLVLAALAAGCGTASEAAPAQPAPPAQPASSGEVRTSCVDVMTRNRACTEAFIPALVDARARHDQPPGIAAAVAADRAAVIAEAMGEWAEDGKDEAIARTCQAMAERLPEAEAGDVAASTACLGKPDCASYVACVTPLFEKRFVK